jgi:MFS family permease
MLEAMPSAADRSPAVRYAWYAVVILTVANVSANVDQYVLNLLVTPIKRDLGITDVQVSYLMGLAFAVFFTVLGVPIARLADRSNRRNIIAIGIALWSLFTAAGAAAHTFGELFVTRIGVGIGEATLTGPSVSLLADYFPRERRARALSVYSLAIFLGAGAAYFIAGWIAGLLSVDVMWHVPVLGAIRPWQSVFLVVGLPGLVIALVFLTVREPSRRHGERSVRLPLSVLVEYVSDNRRTFATQSLGFACSSLVNLGLASWLPSFLTRTYEWSASRAGLTMGVLTMTIGTVGVIAGGWIADWFVKRGRVDGPLRVGIIGALGMLVSATALPLMPTAGLAIAWLAVVNFFAALPWGAASAAAAEIAPGPLRAQGVALYFFVVSFISRTIGPSSVAWIATYVFHNERTGLRYSLPIVNVVGMGLAIVFLSAGLGSYRRTIEYRDAWIAARAQSNSQ